MWLLIIVTWFNLLTRRNRQYHTRWLLLLRVLKLFYVHLRRTMCRYTWSKRFILIQTILQVLVCCNSILLRRRHVVKHCSIISAVTQWKRQTLLQLKFQCVALSFVVFGVAFVGGEVVQCLLAMLDWFPLCCTAITRCWYWSGRGQSHSLTYTFN